MSSNVRSLDDWLQHAGHVHRVGIDLGLERIGAVAEQMGFEAPGFRPAPRSVIVAGTNGKGSTCVALEALLRAVGLKVGTTLSPHLHVFNERVRVHGEMLDDATLCSAFVRVEAARAGIPLTYFEFSALVALHCFREAGVDVAILEVGLGGRLDAFNLVDAEVAVITSIGLEHQDWLGDDLEVIGREKAGVMRPAQSVVLGADVTDSVVEAARQLGCHQTRAGVDFHHLQHGDRWDHLGTTRQIHDIPLGNLAPANCALALEAAGRLAALPNDVQHVLGTATLEGRLERWSVGDDEPALLVLDVAHNPAGARFLAEQLTRRFPGRRFVAVLGTLADKDSAGVAAELGDLVRGWVCMSTRGPRGQSGRDLAARIASAAGCRCTVADEVTEALGMALSSAQPGDGILAFGSFDLVERMRVALLAGCAGARPAGALGMELDR